MLIGLLMAAGLSGAEPPARVGRLSYVYGSVSFRPASVPEWAPASLNLPLSNGDHLWTDRDAQAEAHVGTTAAHLAPETGFSVVLLDERVFRMGLSEGALNVRIPRMNDGESVEVQTPSALFRLELTGSYRLDVDPEAGFVSIAVRSGGAEATAAGQTFFVGAGQRLALSGDPLQADRGEAPAPDPWDDWCASRDELAERGLEVSETYVSWEIAGAEDLAAYGDWLPAEAYGECWRPRDLPAGWAPYRFGHWIYKAPWGWTWVDDAPWGFAPSHFGRWTRMDDAWVWLPDKIRGRPKYSPALVAFSAIKGASHVAWVPLGPGEEAGGRNRAYRNRGDMTAAPVAALTGSRSIAATRVALVDRGTTVFSERAPDLAPARESILGGRPIPVPAKTESGQPASARGQEPQPPAAAQPRADEPRRSVDLRRLDEQKIAGANRRGESGRGSDEQGQAEERRRADEQRQAAEQRRADEQRQADEQRRAEEQGRAEARRRADEQRQTDEQRRSAEQRRADEQRQADEQRRVEEQGRAEARRRADEQRQADEQRRSAEQRRADEQRRAEEQGRAEARRQADEQRRQADEQRRQADEQRRSAEQRRADEQRQADEQRRQADEQRRGEEQRKAEEQRKQDEARKK